MGKPLSEEAKQKIRDAFAAKRLAKETALKEKEQISIPADIIYIPMEDNEKLIEMGKQIQEGKMIRRGYTMGSFTYTKI